MQWKSLKNDKLKKQLEEYVDTLIEAGFVVKEHKNSRHTVAGKIRTLYILQVDNMYINISVEANKLKTIVVKDRVITTPQDALRFNPKKEAQESIKYIQLETLKKSRKKDIKKDKKMQGFRSESGANEDLKKELETLKVENEALKKELEKLQLSTDGIDLDSAKPYLKKGRMYVYKNPLELQAFNKRFLVLALGKDVYGNPLIRISDLWERKKTSFQIDYGLSLRVDDFIDEESFKDSRDGKRFLKDDDLKKAINKLY